MLPAVMLRVDVVAVAVAGRAQVIIGAKLALVAISCQEGTLTASITPHPMFMLPAIVLGMNFMAVVVAR